MESSQNNSHKSANVHFSFFFIFEFNNYISFRNLKLYSREITKTAAATQEMHVPVLSTYVEQIYSVCLFLCLLSFVFSFNQGPNLFNSIFIYLVIHPWNPSKRNLKYLIVLDKY